jgi:hypothetical protein
MRKLRTNANLNETIDDYLNSDLKVVEIAQKHHVSVATLSAWIEASGVPRRSRGRMPLANPSEHSQRILDYAAGHGFSKAAQHFNISKQMVSSLAKRWAVRPPKRLTQATPNGTDLRDKNRERKPPRDLVVSFRLRASELSLLSASLPESVTLSTKSPHKLVRAAIFQRLENLGQIQNGAALNTANSPIQAVDEQRQPKAGSSTSPQS